MLRRLELNDIDCILTLLNDELVKYEQSIAKAELTKEKNYRLVYEEKNRIVGFAVVTIDGELYIYVKEKRRNQGIGEQLLCQIAEYCERQQMDTIRAEVRTEKFDTTEFFLNRGFSRWFGYQEMKYVGHSMEATVELSNYQPKQYEKYKQVYEECFYDMRRALDLKPYSCCSKPHLLEEDKGSIYMLWEKEELIGSVTLHEKSVNHVEIDDLIVNKKFQRNGYGRRLLHSAIAKLQQEYRNREVTITLGVALWNSYAIALYEECGFVCEKRCEVIRKKCEKGSC